MEECNPEMLNRALKLVAERSPKGTQITTDMVDAVIKELKEKKDANK